MSVLQPAFQYLKRSLKGPDFRTMQTSFTQEDEKKWIEAMRDPSFKGMVARMRNADLQRSIHNMRGTNVQDMVKNLDKIIEETAKRNQKGGFHNNDIKQVSATLKTVSALLEKNENNQQLTNIQTMALIKGLEQMERFMVQTKRGDLNNTGEARLEREIVRQLKENSSSMLTSKNLSRVMKGKNSKDDQDKISFLEKSRGARNILYTMLGPLGPVVKSIDDLVEQMYENKETFKKVGKTFKTGWQLLKKFGSAVNSAPGWMSSIGSRLGGAIGGRFGKAGVGGMVGGIGGRMLGKAARFLGGAGAVYGAFELGQLIGEVLNEFLPEDFKEKLGNAIGFLVDELPKKLSTMVNDFLENTKKWFSDTWATIKGWLPAWMGGGSTPKPAEAANPQSRRATTQQLTSTLPNNYSAKPLGFMTAMNEGKADTVTKDNNGAYAYGKYQFNAKGALGTFFKVNPEYADKFAGMDPNSPDFHAKWKQLARTDPYFEKAQDKAAAAIYQPALDQASKYGFDTSNRGVQEAIISGSINHSPQGNQAIWRDASSRAEFSKGPEGQVQAFYAARRDYVKRANIQGGDPVREGLYRRYAAEEKMATNMAMDTPDARRRALGYGNSSAPGEASGGTSNSGGTTVSGHTVNVASIPLVSEDAGMILGVNSTLVY